MKRCIAAGASKINVNRLVLDDYYVYVQEQTGKVPHTTLIERSVEKIIAQTSEWMEICGSTGKA
jgi:fructose-bisphosphate aldolase class II